MSNFQDKQKYWEWRQKNNPFADPSKKDYKPGFFEVRTTFLRYDSVKIHKTEGGNVKYS